MPELYQYQEKCVNALLNGKHFIVVRTGLGKTAIAMQWAKRTGKKNVLVITTPRKRDAKRADGRYDMEYEADLWCGDEWRKSLCTFKVIAWTQLPDFISVHMNLNDWAIIGDEIAAMKAGVRSQRGKAFLKATMRTKYWAGFTATPGDRWIDYQAYAIATGLVKNLTEFRSRFCNIQTYKGYPEIVGYTNTDALDEWWDRVSYRPDTTEMQRELPDVINHVVELPLPKGYKEFERTHTWEGEFIETAGGVNHTRRRIASMDKARQEWLMDYLENNDEPTVIFTNYTVERDMIEEMHKRLRPDNKCWRIDGKHHENPTREAVKKGDIIVVDYNCGAEALELQFCHYCVFYSYTYVYYKAQQAKGRVYRKGQTEITHYYYLESPRTIDGAIKKALQNKKDFAYRTWSPEEEGEE